MIAVVAGTNLTTPDTTRSYTVTVGPHDLTSAVQWDSLQFEDQGTGSQGTTDFRINGSLADYPGVRDQQWVEIEDHIAGGLAFRGFIDSRQPLRAPAWNEITVTCSAHDSILDNVIPLEIRPEGESDRARIGYLWGRYATGFLAADLTYVQQVDSSLPGQTFAGVTLRQAIDMIAAQASASAFFYLDAAGRLHYGTSESNDAPKNVTSDTPGAGEIAPMDLDIDFDSKGYVGAVFVRGKNDAGSGWVYSESAKANHSGLVRTAFLDAADCTTEAMRNALGNMYLGRVGAAIPRGSFTCTSQDSDGWRAGQNVTVRSTHLGSINQAYRIARVRTSILGPSGSRPAGMRQYEVEFGGARGGSGSGSGPVVGTGIVGDLLDDQGNLLIGSGTSSTSGGFGPALRRYITSGVHNGDFAEAPPYPESSIVDEWNPLPYWTFTQAGGVAITATSDVDTDSGSGRILTFQMAGVGGDAADDSYIEQIIPVNSSRSQSFAYRIRVAFETGSTVSTAKFYIKAQYLKNDGVTTTGVEGTLEQTTTSIGASTIVDRGVVASTDGQDGGQVPTDAYYLRVRVGFKRDVAATTVAESLSVLEVVCIAGATTIMIPDLSTPANIPARIQKDAGVLYVLANEGSPLVLGPSLGLDVPNDRISLSSSSLFSLGSTSFPASPATNNLYYRTDHAMWFRWDGTRWACDCPHEQAFVMATTVTMPLAATATNAFLCPLPVARGLDILLEEYDCFFIVQSGGTALSASHSWVGTIIERATGTLLSTLSIASGASNAFRNVNDTGDDVVDLTSAEVGLTLTWTKTGTPGDLRQSVRVGYRFIAT